MLVDEGKVDEVVVDKTQQKGIDSILEDFVTPAPVEEQKPVVEEKKDEPKGEERTEEKAGEQKPVDSKPSEEVKEEVAPIVAEVPKPVEKSDLDKAREEIEELRKAMGEMAAKFVEPPIQPKKTPEQIAAEEAARKAQPPQVYKFIKDDDQFDDIMKTSDNFNSFLTNFANNLVQHTLRMVPQVATNLVDSQLTLRTTAQEFYQANPDLIPHKKYVGFVANELAAQHADWDLPTLLQNAEREVRSRLKMAPNVGAPGSVVQNEVSRVSRTVDSNPGFVPSGGGGRRGVTQSNNLTGMEKDVMDLIS